MSITPIFILSLPRAGSTLTQRLMSLHNGIATKSEPWIALPLFYSLRNTGLNAVYGHKSLSTAVSMFVDSLPSGVADYYSCVSTFLQELYTRASSNEATYFIDKTPRYHLIVSELLDAFPNAKFIFLWRNPLAISASMIQTYGKGKWVLYMFMIDLYSGIESLTDAYCRNKERALSVSYESLVLNPDVEMDRITSYLELDSEPHMADKLEKADVLWGDRTGQYKYNSVSTDSINSWRSIMATPFRKSWGEKYLNWIGKERLSVMGYDLDALKNELIEWPTIYKYLLSDIARNMYGKIYSRYCIEDIRSNKPWRENIYFPKS